MKGVYLELFGGLFGDNGYASKVHGWDNWDVFKVNGGNIYSKQWSYAHGDVLRDHKSVFKAKTS